MKRIAIFQANLKVGGIQKSLYNLIMSGFFSTKKYCVDLYLFDRDVFFDLSNVPSNIQIKFHKPFPYLFRLLPFKLIRFFKKPDIDLSGYDYVIDYDSYRQECAYYTTMAKSANKIMWIHSDMKLEYKYNIKYKILYFFFKKKYRYYDQFAAVSNGIVNSFYEMSLQKDKNVIVIPNMVNVGEIIDKSRDKTSIHVDDTKINVVCVGRIYYAKGYDFLLNDFKEAYKYNKNLNLHIIGDGPDKKRFSKWVKKHNLENVVFFWGNQKNPYSAITKMDAFCIESRYEGQGIVLMEAKVLGLQLIFPKRLEKYCYMLNASNNIAEALTALEKKEKKPDYINEYSEHIRKQLCALFNDFS